MSDEPTWADLLTRYPELGDLMAAIRAYRGDDPERVMWQPGGISERRARLIDDDDAAQGAALYILWRALPARKGESMDLDTMTVPERIEAAERRLLAVSDRFHRMAERQRGKPPRTGDPLTSPAFLDALAMYAAAVASGDDDAITAASDRVIAALPDAPRTHGNGPLRGEDMADGR